MKYSKTEYKLQGNFYKNGIISYNPQKTKTEINLLSKVDLSIFSNLELDSETFLSSIGNDRIILYHFKKEGYYKVNLKNNSFEFIKNHLVPEYVWNDGIILFLDRKQKNYKCIKDNKLLYEFTPTYPIVNNWNKFGVIQYMNDEKSNNWLKCLDPNGGKEKWKKELQWQIIRCEQYDNLLILDYHAYENKRTDEGYEGEIHWAKPNIYTIVLDAETGTEIWKKKFHYSVIDKTHGAILSDENDKVFELDIRTGNTITETKVTPDSGTGHFPHFVDKEGIYYINDNGSFGKINKQTGIIEWEFDLKDEKGEKRKLSDWLLLGNGQLVLQTMPNHPNGDFTCIFDPLENLEYSNIKNGNYI